MDQFSSLTSFFTEQSSVLYLFGVFVLSLLGSTHCLVMCVPIAAGVRNLSWYHFGRLISYFVIGLVLYYFTNQFLKSPYYQLAVGFLFLLYFIYSFFHAQKQCHVKEASSRSFVTGIMNGILPCGWLYLSLYLFAQKESLGLFIASVIIFWSATLPVFFVLNFKKIILEKYPSLFKKQVRFGLYILASLMAFTLHFKRIDTHVQKADVLMCLPWK